MKWRDVEFNLLVRGVLVAVIGYAVLFCRVAYAQSVAAPGAPIQTMGGMFYTSTTQDPWFWAFIGGWVFSSIVSGMPEPEIYHTPFYVWAYRSLHLLAGIGTSYFQHKDLWPEMKAEKAVKD